MTERVVLAYSGGLDTSVAIGWIAEQTGAEVIALAVDVGQGGEDLGPWRRSLGRVFPEMLSCGCMVIASATLLAQAGGGLYWLVPSVITALVFGLLNVWVLLVEILR